jgi:hypothetical protein
LVVERLRVLRIDAWQGDYARDVQASEVQVRLPPGDAVCRLLGVRRRLAHKRQFARVAASRRCAGCRSGAHAHPPGIACSETLIPLKLLVRVSAMV